MGRGASLAYAALRRSGIAGLRRRRDRAILLCLHNVVPDPLAGAVGDRSLHLGHGRFVALIDWLAHAFDVVPLGEVVARLAAGRSVGGLAVLTFDDAYLGVVTEAVPELNRRGLPASIFAVAGRPDVPAPFWWDRLAGPDGLGEPDRTRCRDELAGDDTRITAAYPDRPGAALADPVHPADWATLRMAASDAIRIESHTMTHPNLARIPLDRARAELTESRRVIAERIGRQPEAVSYPFGLSTEAATRTAGEVGYRAGLALGFGRVGTGDDPLALARINVPAGLTVDGLACWTAGLRWNPPR